MILMREYISVSVAKVIIYFAIEWIEAFFLLVLQKSINFASQLVHNHCDEKGIGCESRTVPLL